VLGTFFGQGAGAVSITGSDEAAVEEAITVAAQKLGGWHEN
jgi:hypothetical protein